MITKNGIPDAQEIDVSNTGVTISELIVSEEETVGQTTLYGEGVTFTVPVWTPASITTSAWYDASDEASITATGNDVDAIADQKGGASLTPTSPSLQPRTGTRAINGLNVVDGAGSLLAAGESLDAPLTPPTSGDLAFYMVGIADTVGNNNQSFYSLRDETRNFQFDVQDDADFYGRIRRNGIGSTDVSMNAVSKLGNAGIIGTVFDFTGIGKYSAFWNGTEEGTAGDYTAKWFTTEQTLRVLANRGGTYCLDGAFGELVVTEDCTTVTRQLIEGYLAHKWGLTANLPVDHPYKTKIPIA
jgi:hypothetical protein